MASVSVCSHCRRGATFGVRLIDETGSQLVCYVCVQALLVAVERGDGDLTVVLHAAVS